MLFFSLVYASPTIFNKKLAYVDHDKGYIGQEPYEISKGETARINFETKTKDKSYDICFDFKGQEDYVIINKFEKKSFFGLFTDDMKDNNKVNNMKCMKTFNDGQIDFDFAAEYVGKGKLKYDILILPSKYKKDFETAGASAELIVLDPYLVGELNESDDLILYMPFNNNLSIQWAMQENDIVAADTRLITHSTITDYSETNCNNPANAYDGSFTTYSYPDGGSGDCEFVWEFKKNSSDTSMKLEVKFMTNYVGDCENTRYLNYSINSDCFDYYSNKVKIRYFTQDIQPFTTFVQCEGSSGWTNLFYDSTNTYCGELGYPSSIYEAKAWMSNTSNFNTYSQAGINASYIINGTHGYYFKHMQNSDDIFRNDDLDLGLLTIGQKGLHCDNANTANTTVGSWNINTTKNWSVSFWIYPETPRTTSVFFDARDGSGTTGYTSLYAYIASNNNLVMQEHITGSNPSNVVEKVKNETWVHVVYTHDFGNNITKLYVNGTLGSFDSWGKEFGDKSSNKSNNYVFCGTYFDSPFEGYIKSWNVYETVLTPEQAEDLYHEGNYTINKLNEANSSIYLDGNSYIYTTDLNETINTTTYWFKNTTSNWVHVANVSGTCYINGKSGTCPPQNLIDKDENQLMIGNGFTGWLDEIMIFDYALSTLDIYQIYSGYNSSVNVIFKDEEDQSIITGFIEVDVFSDTYAKEYTTTNGKLFINGFPSELVTIRYKSDNYYERFYYVNLSSRSNLNTTLYMLNSSIGNEITATIYDNQGVGEIENAYIKYLRYWPTNNSYVMVGMAKTNEEGEATLPMVKNDEYYKFMIYYGWSNLRSITNPTYIFNDNINFNIKIRDDIGEEWDTTYGIDHDLTYNNVTRNFRYDFSNVAGATTESELKVYSIGVLGSTLVNSSTLTATSGTILVKIPHQNATYIAQALVNYDDSTNIVESLQTEIKEKPPFSAMGIIAVILLTLTFMFIGYYSLSVMVVLVPLPTLYGSLIGLVTIDFHIALILEVIAIIVAVIIKR